MKRLFILNLQDNDSLEFINPENQHIMLIALGKDNVMFRCNGGYLMVEDIYLGKYGTCVDGIPLTKNKGILERRINEFNDKYNASFHLENVIRVNNLEEMVI